MLRKHIHSGRIRFTTNQEVAIRENEIIFICVGTPSRPDGSANLQFVQQVAENIGCHMNNGTIVVTKSTVPVGTVERIEGWIRSKLPTPMNIEIASNPEFLREGTALYDALNPDRIIIGSTSEKAIQVLTSLYSPLHAPIVVKRIGPHFLQAGIGYGGSCFPKDVASLLHVAKEHGMDLTILEKAVEVNTTQAQYLLDKVYTKLSSFQGKTIGLLGLAFKPGTDDTRESPALTIIQHILAKGATMKVHDPIAQLPEELLKKGSTKLIVCPTPYQVADEADALILCTDWPEYEKLEWMRIRKLMKQPVILDGRNQLDSQTMKSHGFHYEGVGYC